MNISDIFLASLVSKGAEATIEEARAFLKSFFSKGTDRTATEFCEIVQKHFGIEQEAALRVIDSLLQKKGIRMRRTVVKGQSVSVKTTDGKFSMEDGSSLRTPKASIQVGKKNDDEEDDDSHFDLEGGASVELTDEGRVELES